MLAEWRRVMKIDAVQRPAVPDFEALAQAHRQTEDLNKILGPLFCRIEIK